MKQLEVQIMGQSYLLGCPEGGEQRLLEAVEKVDTIRTDLGSAGDVIAHQVTQKMVGERTDWQTTDAEIGRRSSAIAEAVAPARRYVFTTGRFGALNGRYVVAMSVGELPEVRAGDCS